MEQSHYNTSIYVTEKRGFQENTILRKKDESSTKYFEYSLSVDGLQFSNSTFPK